MGKSLISYMFLDRVCQEHMLYRFVWSVICSMCWVSSRMCVFIGIPADCREILLPLMTDQLKFHLEKREELKACCQLLSDILEVLYRKDVVSNSTLELYIFLFPSWINSSVIRQSRNSSIKKKNPLLTVVIVLNNCLLVCCSQFVLLPCMVWKEHVLRQY